jgi:transcriptional regulator with XRE-family HTH domain
MAISKDDIVERNSHITNNYAINMHIGKCVRLRRALLGMIQGQLGAELNVTSQQVQRYERGANRISASRLWDISQILDVPISYFFDNMSEGTMRSSPRWINRGDNADVLNGEQIKDPMARRETLELVRTYSTIEKSAVRKWIAKMVKSIATTLAGE